jgi:hypothetical protein
MSTPKLIGLAGMAAILAGALRAISWFIPISEPSTLEILNLITNLFIFFGILGLYGFQNEESGIWGFSGFLFAFVGMAIITGPDGQFDSITMNTGILISNVGTFMFPVGLILLAIGSWRANKLPRWIPMLWILSTIVGLMGSLGQGFKIFYGLSRVIFGVSFVGAGLKLWSGANVAIEKPITTG